MTGYIILGVFVAFVIGCLASFLGGLAHGKKIAEAQYAEEQRRRDKSEKEFQEAKSEILQETFKGAAEQKAELAGHTNSSDRFDAINSSLRNNSKDRSGP